MSINSHEAVSLEYTGVEEADLLFKHNRKQEKKNAFPFLEGIQVEEKVVLQSLGLQTYLYSKGLLKLLGISADVMTVSEAQEKFFLADAAAA